MDDPVKLYDGAVIKPDGTAAPPARRADDLPPGTPWYAALFVSGLRDCWKWASTWFTALAAAAPIAYEFLSDPTCTAPLYHAGCVQLLLSPSAFRYLESGLVLLIFLARIKRQP